MQSKSKNNVDKIMESKSDKSVAEILDKLAKKDPEVLMFDAINEALDTLKLKHLEEAPDLSFEEFLNSKDDDYFKRLEYSYGGKVIQFPTDMTKWRENPKIKEINMNGEMKDRMIDSLSKSERDLVNRLLRISLGKEVD